MKGLHRALVLANLISQFSHSVPVQGKELCEPFVAVLAVEAVGQLPSRLRQPQRLGECLDILRLNFIVADAYLTVRGYATAVRRRLVQCENDNPTAKKLLESLDLSPALAIGPRPAVFVVHVKDQNPGLSGLHKSGKQLPHKECLACAGFTKDAYGSLSDLLQVENNVDVIHGKRLPYA